MKGATLEVSGQRWAALGDGLKTEVYGDGMSDGEEMAWE